MRILVRRTGGFAGIERAAEVDTAGRADETDWRTLADAAAAGDPGEGPGPEASGPPGSGAGRARVPDGFVYEITVDGRTFQWADPRLSDAQRRLVTRVLREGSRPGA
jgi:hypothetical protein